MNAPTPTPRRWILVAPLFVSLVVAAGPARSQDLGVPDPLDHGGTDLLLDGGVPEGLLDGGGPSMDAEAWNLWHGAGGASLAEDWGYGPPPDAGQVWPDEPAWSEGSWNPSVPGDSAAVLGLGPVLVAQNTGDGLAGADSGAGQQPGFLQQLSEGVTGMARDCQAGCDTMVREVQQIPGNIQKGWSDTLESLPKPGDPGKWVNEQFQKMLEEPMKEYDRTMQGYYTPKT